MLFGLDMIALVGEPTLCKRDYTRGLATIFLRFKRTMRDIFPLLLKRETRTAIGS
jgi:hypothetical protein